MRVKSGMGDYGDITKIVIRPLEDNDNGVTWEVETFYEKGNSGLWYTKERDIKQRHNHSGIDLSLTLFEPKTRESDTIQA